MNLDPLRPYVSAIKWIAGLLIVSVVFYGGCSAQAGRDAKRLAAKDRIIEQHKQALGVAAQSLRQSAAALREVGEQTRANEAAARLRERAAESAAADARKASKQAQTARATLERKLDAERRGCVDGGRPVCGLPLL